MSRISVEVALALHRTVLDVVAVRGITVQEFMLDALANQLRWKVNVQDTAEVLAISAPALQRDWDNECDAAYDELG
jgi:hypothetical protein